MALWLQGVILLFALYGVAVLLAGISLKARKAWFGPRESRPFISLLLIARNKSSIIEGLIRNLAHLGYLRGEGLASYEIVVVDDYSTDETGRILDRLVRSLPILKAVKMEEVARPGESAVEVGLFLCRSKVVLVLDLQGQVEPRALLQAVHYLLGEKKGCPAEYRVRSYGC